jgi:hypothetical protein
MVQAGLEGMANGAFAVLLRQQKEGKRRAAKPERERPATGPGVTGLNVSSGVGCRYAADIAGYCLRWVNALLRELLCLTPQLLAVNADQLFRLFGELFRLLDALAKSGLGLLDLA